MQERDERDLHGPGASARRVPVENALFTEQKRRSPGGAAGEGVATHHQDAISRVFLLALQSHLWASPQRTRYLHEPMLTRRSIGSRVFQRGPQST